MPPALATNHEGEMKPLSGLLACLLAQYFFLNNETPAF